ncbi:hypothetical protein MMC07_009476 [Pseudocyphellaria aurata]|nr:hypothetical protein [Pseudocyphellaria aurata]
MGPMAVSSRSGAGVWFGIIVILLSVFNVAQVSSLSQIYCSSENTGDDLPSATSLYQSNGLCFTHCSDNYAFAIVQYQHCWCSDYIPAETTSVSSCGEDCPGFPDEKCGSLSAGLFGYIALSKSPSGTLGAASSSPSISSPTEAAESSTQVVSNPSPGVALGSPSSSAQASSSASSAIASQPPSTPFLGPSIFSPIFIFTTQISPLTHVLTSFLQSSLPDPSSVTVQTTVTALPSIKVVSVTPLTSPSITPSVTPSTSSSHTTTSSSSTPPPVIIPVKSTTPTTTPTSTPTTSPSETPTWSATPITSVITVTGQVKTLTITPTAPPEATAQAQGSGKREGPLSNAGKAAGLSVGVVLIAIIIAVFIIRGVGARRRRKAEAIAITSNTGDNTPQRRPSRLSQMGLVSGHQRPNNGRVVPGIQTSGWGPGTGAERSPTDTTTPLDRRTSYPRVVDQRLDPVALWNPLHDNGSHISVRSFRDDQDYSRRMLRVANPDD